MQSLEKSKAAAAAGTRRTKAKPEKVLPQFDLKTFLEKKKMERENKIGSGPGVIVPTIKILDKTCPSPNENVSNGEDDFMRHGTRNCAITAAEQQNIIGRKDRKM